MLLAAQRPGLSKTAGSRPCHRDAGRRGYDLGTRSIRQRRLANDVMERAAESAQARETNLHADVGHRSLRFAQHEHGALDPAALQVAMRRLAERSTKGPDVMSFRDVGNLGQAGDVETLRVRQIDCVPRAEHAAVDLLDDTTHAMIKA